RGILLTTSRDYRVDILAKAHSPVNIQGEGIQTGLLGRPAKGRDDQRAQTNTDLHAQRAAAGVDDIIEMRREKNMPVACRNIINTFQLQRDFLHESFFV